MPPPGLLAILEIPNRTAERPKKRGRDDGYNYGKTVRLQDLGPEPDGSGARGHKLVVCEAGPRRHLHVTSTNDSGQGSLRQAILDANARPGADVIRFSIPGGGVKTIRPASQMPEITDTVTVDGYSQPGASPNSRPTGGLDTVILVELDGLNGEVANGLQIAAPNVVVRGLAINRFRCNGIQTAAGANGVRIEGNYVGTDPSGTLDRGNIANGLNIRDGGSHTIGGITPDKRNLISGNNAPAINLEGKGGNKVQGNLIGVQRDATSIMGGSAQGVDIDSPNNIVGGLEPGATNTIAFSVEEGVSVGLGSGNRILGNSVFSNGRLGIDLEGGIEDAADRTVNDPRDRDTGPNTLQNFPTLSSAEKFSSDKTVVKGTLDSTPSTRRKKRTFMIQLFANDADSDASAEEGETFLGQTRVTTNRQGLASFTFEVTRPLAVGDRVIATATGRGGHLGVLRSRGGGPRPGTGMTDHRDKRGVASRRPRSTR